jgi:hypothetical protein
MESTAAAYGIYPDHIALPEIAYSLSRAGFDKKNICMVVPPAHPVAKIVRDANVLNLGRESSAISARIIEWISQLGAVVIPSVGLFIRSQAFFRALIPEQDLHSFSGKSRTLYGLGFSEDDAERLDMQMAEGAGVLVYVACGQGSKTDAAVELLRSTGAQGIAILHRARAVGAA